MFSFLKVTTDDGIVGWSEFNESFGSTGLSDVIRGLSPVLIGRDPRMFEQVTQHLHVLTRQSRGGLNQQALAAIENALLDVTGKAFMAVPVFALFGGPIRDRIPVYCVPFWNVSRQKRALMGVPSLSNYDDLARHAEEVKKLGFKALKNQHHAIGWWHSVIIRSRIWSHTGMAGTELGQQAHTRCDRATHGYSGGRWTGYGHPSRYKLQFQDRRLQAYRRGRDAGKSHLARDRHAYAPALAEIKRSAPCPIASCETLHGRREFKPFFDNYATDVAIIDVIWNGLNESLKIAAMADVYEVNVAPHNFYGHLCSAISATFSAIVPNFRVMEIDIDSAPWRDEFIPLSNDRERRIRPAQRSRMGHRCE